MTVSRFVWHDLMTRDMRRAETFYTSLLGWTTSHFDMGAYGTYAMLTCGALDIGGIVDVARSWGEQAHWLSYVNVPDLDARVERAVRAGATTRVAPSEIPNVGRYAVIEDPVGALLGIFTRHGGDNPEPDGLPPARTFCWDELRTSDLSLGTFYAQLFGWTVDRIDVGGFGPYDILRREGKPIAGIARSIDGGARWLPYVTTDGPDAVAQRARALGGRVLAPPQEMPVVGRYAIVEDPFGARLAVVRRAVA